MQGDEQQGEFSQMKFKFSSLRWFILRFSFLLSLCSSIRVWFRISISYCLWSFHFETLSRASLCFLSLIRFVLFTSDGSSGSQRDSSKSRWFLLFFKFFLPGVLRFVLIYARIFEFVSCLFIHGSWFALDSLRILLGPFCWVRHGN